jgi:hypothetical protein
MVITEPEGRFIIHMLSQIDKDFKGKPFG